MENLLLVLDDNPSDLLITSSYLESLGYGVISNDNGKEAILNSKKYYPNGFIVDLQMPQLGGIEFIKIIRSTPNFVNHPILVISAKKEATDVKEAIIAGANDYLLKPIDSQILEQKLKRLIGAAEQWTDYSIPESSDLSIAKLFLEVKVLSINEISAKISTSKQLPLGCHFEIELDIFKNEKNNLITGTIITSEKSNNNNFISELNFNGLDEERMKTIRLHCRRLWVESKNK